MDDEELNVKSGDEANVSDIEETKKKRGRPKTGKSSAEKKAAVKAAPKAKPKVGSATCFVCPSKKKANARFCVEHQKMVSAIEYQAKRASPEKVEEVKKVLQDERCLAALEEFERNNPPGAFRKKFKPIDFDRFLREHGVTLAETFREEHEQIDFACVS